MVRDARPINKMFLGKLKKRWKDLVECTGYEPNTEEKEKIKTRKKYNSY